MGIPFRGLFFHFSQIFLDPLTNPTKNKKICFSLRLINLSVRLFITMALTRGKTMRLRLGVASALCRAPMTGYQFSGVL